MNGGAHLWSSTSRPPSFDSCAGKGKGKTKAEVPVQSLTWAQGSSSSRTVLPFVVALFHVLQATGFPRAMWLTASHEAPHAERRWVLVSWDVSPQPARVRHPAADTMNERPAPGENAT
eukprot:CAMPEP_0119363800 /NCGR_PEP_ID=MMETSP1334-20130426/10726_1 /TAXON_ID=127549 /ORGANISM="Calcidiscus leptoporus, Strain RCC1130" /LENGTH=117 /DNA_ID=CAMNT_0007379343 /DNA_START=129 /DNA_END=483 /DNA_ORIENTATION=+